MKKLIFFALFSLVVSASTNAQCSHASKASESKTCVKPSEKAMKAAAMDETIETKVCEKSGKVCFLRKSENADGTTTSTEVSYDEATASFVALPASSDDATSAKKSCSKDKACCAKGAKKGCCSKAKGTASVENVAPEQRNEKSE